MRWARSRSCYAKPSPGTKDRRWPSISRSPTRSTWTSTFATRPPLGSAAATAGRSDEYYLDLGAQAFAAELDKLDVPYTLELFDGTHARLTYRYPGAIRELITALSPRAQASTEGHGP